MSLFVLLMSACNGCEACRPQLPNPPDDPPVQDTADREDTADTAAEDTAPTGPPARCDVEEVEPNDFQEQAQLLPMEVWACGEFQRVLDLDWFTFSSTQPGWIEITGEVGARGSRANAQIQLVGADGSSALAMDSYLSTDPRMVFPADAPGSWSLALSETNRDFGADFGWYMMATSIKAPVTWTFDEVEDNDAAANAQPFELGETVFGRVEAPGDLDWYVITTPDGENTLTFDVEAYKAGSVANLKLILYRADGTTIVRTDYRGEIDYDPDPWFQQRTSGVQTYFLLVRTEDDRGSPYHWYTMTVSSTTNPPSTP